MKTIKYICCLALAAATLTLGSCSSDVEMPATAESALNVEVGGMSRAPIYENSLPDPSEFTIGCINLTSGKYRYDLRDVEYSGGNARIMGDPVMLRDDSTYQVVAIYPRIENKSELLSGELRISAFEQIDYMKAQTDKITYQNNNAVLNFKHMFALLRLNFRKSDFITDDYHLYYLIVSSVGREGVFNLIEQDFISTTLSEFEVVVDKSIESDKYVTVDLMVIPSKNDTSNMWLWFGNGKSMDFEFKHNAFLAGNIYTFNITVSADQLAIMPEEIKPWNTTNSETNINKALAAPGKAVDLGLSKLWADRNAGAYSPLEYGEYYNNLQSASDIWGTDWETPTPDDFNELINKCTWKWVNNGGINGYQVSGNGNSIFLPAAGWIYEPNWSYNDLNQGGLYSSSDEGAALEFSPNAKNVASGVNHQFIRSIRPVKVKK